MQSDLAGPDTTDEPDPDAPRASQIRSLGQAGCRSPLRIPPFQLASCIAGVRRSWPDSDIEPAIVGALPPCFHDAPRIAQQRLLEERAPRTGARWGSLLAATVEHLALIHGRRVPEWVDEPARFLRIHRVLPATPAGRWDALMYAPAADLRHRAIPDPRDLDAQSGKR